MALLAFALDYTRHRRARSKRFWAQVATVPVIYWLLLVSDTYHGLGRTDARLVPGDPFGELEYSFTAATRIVALYSYVLILSGLGVLFAAYRRAPPLYRRQIATVGIGVLFPVVGTILTLGGVRFMAHNDTTPFTFVIRNLIVAWGLFRYRLLDLVPVARDTVIEQMSDAVAVLDGQHRVLDLNPAAQRVICQDAAEALGRPAAEVLCAWNELAGLFALSEGARVELQMDAPDETRHMEITISVLRDRGGVPSGHVVVMRDITTRKQAEAELERYRQNLAQLVSERTTELTAASEQVRRQTARLQALHEMDRDILAARSPDEIAQAAMRHIRQLVPCQRAGVAVVDIEAREAIMLATHIEGQPIFSPRERIPMDGPWFESLRNSATRVEADLRQIPDPPIAIQRLVAGGVRSLIVVPLRASGEWIGSLNLLAHEPDAFRGEHIEVAEEIAGHLAIAIHQARLHEQVQRYADDLEQRVAERTAALETANRQLQALTRVKDEFVANVSHELRTPITSLKLRLHLLTRNPEARPEHLATLGRETDRLNRLIEDLLMLSRLDQDRAAFECQSLDLNTLVGHFVTDRAPLAEHKDLTLSFDPHPDLPPAQADPNLLGEVLSILLTNALNYTHGGGVTVRTHGDTQRVGFSVSDTGPGIALDEQGHLFTRFYRGAAGRESGVSGTGLGLAIAREIVARHQGQIEVESAGVPGQGATFRVWVPAQLEES
jgi:PAS domain S-box-containing protein